MADGLLIRYTRCSTEGQDLTAQRPALTGLGVAPDRIYADHGLTGRNRNRPGLRQALAACREGDTLAVAKLDRLARSVPDARDILEELTTRGGQAEHRRVGARPGRPGGPVAVHYAVDGG